MFKDERESQRYGDVRCSLFSFCFSFEFFVFEVNNIRCLGFMVFGFLGVWSLVKERVGL